MCISKGDELDPPFAEARVRCGYRESKGNAHQSSETMQYGVGAHAGPEATGSSACLSLLLSRRRPTAPM